jgi:two-component system OmpR family response regulator
VRDGRDADAAVATTPYDVVLLDLGLPRRDGLSLLKSWRANPRRAGAHHHRAMR